MRTLQGEKLKQYVNDGLSDIVNSRFLLKDLHNYMISKNDRKVCCLCGLRRTGKTIMVLQETKKLDDYNNTLFVRCEDGDTTWNLKKTIDEALTSNPQIKYIFVDEATKAKKFINTCSFLADDYAMTGKKVVLAGTDSLSFAIAEPRELFGRAHILRTTYIPFKEYTAVLGKNIDDYMRYGGTLTDGENNVFYNKDLANKYTNSAIVENIANSIRNWDNGRNPYFSLFSNAIKNNEFPSIVNKILEYHNHKFLKIIVNEAFNANDLKSTADMMFKQIPDIDKLQLLESDEFTERIRVALGIKENLLNKIDNSVIVAVIESLENLDVLSVLPNDERLNIVKTNPGDKDIGRNYDEEYVFIQPGMRYAQIKSQLNALSTSNIFKERFSNTEQKAILTKLESDVLGQMLEDIILYQLAMDIKASGQQDYRKISKYRTQSGEFDAVIFDYKFNGAFAIEVKHSDKMVDNQRKHLKNDAACLDFEKKTGLPITNKVIIYRGNNGESEDGILYINASDFLIKSQEMMNTLLTYREIRTFEQLMSLMNTDFFGNGDSEQAVKLPEPKTKETPKKKHSSGLEH